MSWHHLPNPLPHKKLEKKLPKLDSEFLFYLEPNHGTRAAVHQWLIEEGISGLTPLPPLTQNNRFKYYLESLGIFPIFIKLFSSSRIFF